MHSRSIPKRAAAFALLIATAAMPLTFTLSSHADARNGAEAPTLATPLSPMMAGFRWGMSHNELAGVYNKVGGLFDKEYDPVLSKVQPGIAQRNVEAERDAKKAAFVSSFVEFKDTPTGYDQREIKNEFTYRNHESVMEVTQYGKHRYFFFINDRFWKLYDESPLGENSASGKNFQDAVTRMQGALGLEGRVRAADPDKGIYQTTVDWQDATTHLRVVDRGDALVGIVLEDRATLNALPQLRANKAEDPLAMDPSVLAITHGKISDPNAARAAASASASAKKK